jgi:hypothetical protein
LLKRCQCVVVVITNVLKVVVKSEKRGEWVFNCKQLFDSRKGDKKIVREFLPSEGNNQSTLGTYSVVDCLCIVRIRLGLF